MKLIKQTLHNFMGINDFAFEPNGHNCSIFADNGYGKTTLFSAFLWVFFDKDSSGRSDFELKTLQDGKAVPMIDHSVELVLEHNGARFTLKKTLSESWVKARGSITAEFSGHKTAYEVDGVPRQKKEFDAFIAGLCDAKLLRMLSDIDYFPGKMEWQDRRRMIMDICGDVSDADVISSDAKLAELNTFLEGRTMDDYKKMMAAKKTLINDQIKNIPVRVDEATRALPDISKIDAAMLDADIAKADAELKQAQEELSAIENGGQLAGHRKKKADIEAKLQQIETEHNRKIDAEKSGTQSVIYESAQKVKMLDSDLILINRQADNAKSLIESLEKRIETKRDEWRLEDGRKPSFDQKTTCPTCGQSIPDEALAEAERSYLEQFNLTRSKRLLEIDTEGKGMREQLLAAQAELADLGAKAKELAAKVVSATDEQNKLQEEFAEEAFPAVDCREDYRELKSELGKINAAIAEIGTDSSAAIEKAKADVEGVRTVRNSLEASKVKLKQHADGKKRIDELKQQEKTLAADYERLERQTWLIEEFIRTKVNMLEEKINSRFNFARFRLFETQVNGGLNEVCEVLGPDLVPYSKGLNNAARINTGIDIANTIAEHYGFTMPLYVDNSEAVTRLIETPAQLIRLIVSEPDKELRAEVD